MRTLPHDGLTGHAAGNAQSSSQNAANGLRSHFDDTRRVQLAAGDPVMMVAATDAGRPLGLQPECQLPGVRLRSKVYKSLAAPAPFPALAAACRRNPVTSRLRELIQQLGEAIHESVIESEQIAGVVQDIRKHGFDVLLMLEATIGLNEVSKDAENAEGGSNEEGNTFTKNDVNFLRSLRISIEGEDEDDNEAQAG